MLELLHIENIAVIEETEIEFRDGFNALTGETGAGKSIVIDALGAVLGGRASRDLVRTGTSKALVSASFSDAPPDLPDGVAPDEDGMLFLQRELSAEGKSVCRINGRPVPAAYDDTAGDEEAENRGAELLIVRDGACLDVFSGAGCHAHAIILPGDAVGAEDRVLTLSASGSLEYCMNELE